MKEDFLHFVWKYKKFDFFNAKSSAGEELQIFQTGQHNQTQSGPDFFNARIKIGDQLWAGNVEVHLKSSDWYVHHHETDSAYDNVILHVVWEHDVEIYRRNNSEIPTLALKPIVFPEALANYRQLLGVKNYQWINCERDFSDFSEFAMINWLERLYIERLELKSKQIEAVLQETTNDWEATFFRLLAKTFGLNVNGDSFLSVAQSFPYAIIRKIDNVQQLEALFYGQAGMLHTSHDSTYFKALRSDYSYLRRKFQLNRQGVLPIQFFRLRPPNFPTIRFSQLAVLVMKYRNLFDRLIAAQGMSKIRKTLTVATSSFWENHYTFAKQSDKPRKKKVTTRFVDLLIINAVIPLKFCYYRQHKSAVNYDGLIDLMRQLPIENNSIVRGFNKLRPKTAQNAFESQALIEIKTQYCDKNRCLHCNLGLKLLQKNRR